MKPIPYLVPLDVCLRYEGLAERLGVSEVARSPRGFMTQYKIVNGKWESLDEYWQNRRNNFCARHLAQLENNNEDIWMVDKKTGLTIPTRRHLALLMWAASPATSKMIRERAKYAEKAAQHVVKNPNDFRDDDNVVTVSDVTPQEVAAYNEKYGRFVEE